MKKYYFYIYEIIYDKHPGILGNGVIEEDDGIFKMFNVIKSYAEKYGANESEIIVTSFQEISEAQYKYFEEHKSK